MAVAWILRLVLITVLTALGSVEGYSVQRNPVAIVMPVLHPIIQAPAHRVSAASSFDLFFNLGQDDSSNSRSHIRLSLKPSHGVISNATTVSLMSANGTIRSTRFLNRLEHKLCSGSAFFQQQVAEAGSVSEWIKAGWASIMVRQDGAKPIFQGGFSIYGDYHHVMTSAEYAKTKVPGDPDIKRSPHGEEHMLVWRNSDVLRQPRAYDPPYNMEEKNDTYRDMAGTGNDSLRSTVPVRLFGRRSLLDGDMATAPGASVADMLTIGSTKGCPTTGKVVSGEAEVGPVATVPRLTRVR